MDCRKSDCWLVVRFQLAFTKLIVANDTCLVDFLNWGRDDTLVSHVQSLWISGPLRKLSKSCDYLFTLISRYVRLLAII
jgi:hypothetical protein